MFVCSVGHQQSMPPQVHLSWVNADAGFCCSGQYNGSFNVFWGFCLSFQSRDIKAPLPSGHAATTYGSLQATNNISCRVGSRIAAKSPKLLESPLRPVFHVDLGCR